MLKFDGSWRFNSPGPIANGVKDEFFSLIRKVAAQGDRQRILEHFKYYFANATGSTSSWSSSTSWAESDLDAYMDDAAANAPLSIEAFFDACVALKNKQPEIAVPDDVMINRILAEHNAGYSIQPPDLLAHNAPAMIAVPQRIASLDEQAQEIIQQSLKQSEEYLALGQYRQAIQEILWLLETVSTIF